MFKNWNRKENFKFKDLKTYGSLESLYKGYRKYRYVFDEAETCYINAELSFYNILFDEEDWETSITLRVVRYHTGKQVCNIKKELKVSKDQNIVYVRDGWGTAQPGFWKKGTYKWEAYIGETMVKETYFYLTNKGLVSLEYNPYFKIKSLRLFESPKGGLDIKKRKYLQTFAHATTRYVNIEVILENLLINEPHFPLELQFNIYNDTGQLKGHMVAFRNIYDKRKEITLDTGYGTIKPSFWYKDKYTIEIIFMDQLIAVIPFEVGEQEIAFTGNYDYTNFSNAVATEPVNAKEEVLSFEETKQELEHLIGLKSVKKQLNEFATYIRFLKIREKKGFVEHQNFNLHSVFIGNPGTGKTTVAHFLGKIYKSLGVLSKGIVHEVGRADLVGEYIGQTAPKVKQAIEQARGGILFIDEAYSLSNRGGDEKDFGREVVEVLLKEMIDGKGDIAIICAGYPKEMEQFLNTNPGLRSRFKQVLHFPDYTPNELMAIAHYTAQKKDVRVEPNALDLMNKYVVEHYRNRNKNFGNARYINGLIEEAKKNMGLRLMNSPNPEELTKDELSTILSDDMAKVFNKNQEKIVQLPIDETLLQEALTDLNALIGLDNIKNEVHEIIKLVRYYKDIDRNLQDAFSLHTVFTGNPGTGKTTLARILVRIYKALGILERGHMIECDRKSLVAGYIGQTAIKTAEKIDEAMGGGLFIDEAYALTSHSGFDYGREAIEVILKRMEDRRGKFMVIVAGYPKEMKQFLGSNPGLKSRFDKTFEFKDYTKNELVEIAENLLKKENLLLTPTSKTYLINHIDILLKHKNKYFGNARAIRKMISEIVRKQHLRLAEVPAEKRTDDIIKFITKDDLKHLQKLGDDERHIGFQMR